MLQTGEVARMLGVSPNTVRDYVRRGWLSCVFSTNGIMQNQEAMRNEE